MMRYSILLLLLTAVSINGAMAAGHVYVTSQDGNGITDIAMDGTETSTFSSLPGPVAVTADPDGKRLF